MRTEKEKSMAVYLMQSLSYFFKSWKVEFPKNVVFFIQCRGGSRIPLGGAPTYDFAKISKKPYRIKKILDCRGAAPLDPLLQWRNDSGGNLIENRY